MAVRRKGRGAQEERIILAKPNKLQKKMTLNVDLVFVHMFFPKLPAQTDPLIERETNGPRTLPTSRWQC